MPLKPALLAALAALLLFAPLAAAGSDADPETGDDANDDVEVNGMTCGLPASPPPNPHGCVWSPDFVWANVDIDWAWVNETADNLTITLEMKAGTAYSPDAGAGGPLAEGDGFTYTYTFDFTVNGSAKQAIAIMGADGVFTLGGVATGFLVHDGNDLTITIPKDILGITANGAVIGALVVKAHGQGDSLTLDDMAPDGATSRDYVVANSTAANATADATAPANNTGSANPGSSGGSVVGSSGPAPNVSGTTSRSATATADGSAKNDEAGEEDTPAVPAVALLAVLAVLAVAVRRRL